MLATDAAGDPAGSVTVSANCVAQLGVVPRWRRHGLGNALLAEVGVTPGEQADGPDDKSRWCPGWESNPHCTVFETAFSASWNTGACPPTAGR
jgi:hypothetical protein